MTLTFNADSPPPAWGDKPFTVRGTTVAAVTMRFDCMGAFTESTAFCNVEVAVGTGGELRIAPTANIPLPRAAETETLFGGASTIPAPPPRPIDASGLVVTGLPAF